MAAPELGGKQLCPNCQAKFYDLNRRPAHCPKCGNDFDPDEAVKSRRIRARATPADYEDEPAEDQVKKAPEAEDEEEEAEATPEIDEAADEPIVADDEDAEGDAAPAPAEDLGVDFEEEAEAEDADEAVPFLEDEDDDLTEDDIVAPGDDEEH